MKKNNIKLNAILNAIKTISAIIFPFITFPYVTSVLQVEGIGKVNFASSFVKYFAILASLGIGTYAIRECATKRKDRNELSKTSSQIFSINFYMTVIAYILLFITMLLFKNSNAEKFELYKTLIILESTGIIFTTIGCDWVNYAMEDYVFITIKYLITQILIIISIFTFVKSSNDYMAYAMISIVITGLENILNVFYRRKYCEIKLTTKLELKRHLSPIIWLFVMVMSQTITSSSDITMLGIMCNDFETGIYSTAYQISRLIDQVIASIVFVLLPQMSIYYEEKNYKRINEMVGNTLNAMVTIGLPSILGCILLSNDIILIISKPEFLPAANVLVILMCSAFFSLLGGAFLGNVVLLSTKREKLFMIICCVCTVANIGANYLLIPLFKASGAAFATLVVNILMFILLIVTKDKQIKAFNNIKIFIPPVIGCIAIVIICYLFGLSISNLYLRTILSVVVSVLVYFVVQILSKNIVVCDAVENLKKKLLTLKNR